MFRLTFSLKSERTEKSEWAEKSEKSGLADSKPGPRKGPKRQLTQANFRVDYK